MICPAPNNGTPNGRIAGMSDEHQGALKKFVQKKFLVISLAFARQEKLNIKRITLATKLFRTEMIISKSIQIAIAGFPVM